MQRTDDSFDSSLGDESVSGSEDSLAFAAVPDSPGSMASPVRPMASSPTKPSFSSSSAATTPRRAAAWASTTHFMIRPTLRANEKPLGDLDQSCEWLAKAVLCQIHYADARIQSTRSA